MTEAILTLDLGTTACKAVVFDPTGKVLGEGQHEYPTYHPQPGAAEQDPADWWNAVVTAGRAALAAAAGVRIIAVGLSSQRETVVPVDEQGTPLRRALTWMDRRSQPQAAALAAKLGVAAVHARTGMLPEATFTATKLRYLCENEPDTLRKAAWLLQPKDYLIMRLTGQPAIDPSLASRTLLWAVSDGWLDDMIEWAGIRKEQLPPVVPSGGVAGVVTEAAAAELGVPAGIPVACGAGDRCCEALGAAVCPDGRGMISTGTATNVSGALDKLPPTLVPGILYTRAAVPGQWLAEQGIATGGSVLKWLRDSLRHKDYTELGQMAAASPAGANGLVLLPFFMGARATRWNPLAKGTWLGLTLGHTQGDMARSVMEAVACEVRACVDVLNRAGQNPAELVMLGGGANSPVWCQIKADVTNRPIVVPRVTGAACLGAMFLGGQAAGLWADPVAAAREANPVVGRYDPVATTARYYERHFALYNKLYTAVTPLYEDLARLAVEEA